MNKRIFVMFVLLTLAVGLYALNVKADSGAVTVTQTAQASSVPTMTKAAKTCEVITGVDAGTVNLRTCGGTSCKVIRVLNERERLMVTTAGAWLKVTTEDGVTGYINSNYCKGK